MFAILVSKATDITAQTLMNVPPLSRTSVTSTLCVQTPKGPMYVAAGEDLKGTEGTVQRFRAPARHLVLQTHNVSKALLDRDVSVALVTKEMDTTAQTSMNVQGLN